jgi:hypothetical protein
MHASVENDKVGGKNDAKHHSENDAAEIVESEVPEAKILVLTHLERENVVQNLEPSILLGQNKWNSNHNSFLL